MCSRYEKEMNLSYGRGYPLGYSPIVRFKEWDERRKVLRQARKANGVVGKTGNSDASC